MRRKIGSRLLLEPRGVGGCWFEGVCLYLAFKSNILSVIFFELQDIDLKRQYIDETFNPHTQATSCRLFKVFLAILHY